MDGALYFANQIVASIPSHRVRLFMYRNLFGFEIGKQSYIFMGAWFDHQKGGFKMGPNSVINQKCRLDNRGGITIGTNVSISAEVCLLTADHDPASPTNDSRIRPIQIEDYAFIGTRAMVLPGVRIGTGAMVGAGAVVAKDVAPYEVVAGVPARKIGTRTSDLKYTIDYKRLFW